MVLSGARTGACLALRWNDDHSRYVCGAVDAPYDVVLSRLSAGLAWLAKPVSAMLPRLARRWIAAGVGCDSNLQPLVLAGIAFSDNPASPLSPDPLPAPPHD